MGARFIGVDREQVFLMPPSVRDWVPEGHLVWTVLDAVVVLADAGYWHRRQMQQIASEGIPVLVPPDAGLRRGPRPGWTGGMYAFMRRVLATPHGHDLYRQRQITVEPVFGQIKFNRAIKRFQRRGRTACRSEWRLIAATHNLLKLHTHRLAATTP